MLEQLSRDIDGNTREKAFASVGGDADDETGADPRDDLMVQSYFANQVSSDAL
jgi:hypothetical protein